MKKKVLASIVFITTLSCYGFATMQPEILNPQIQKSHTKTPFF